MNGLELSARDPASLTVTAGPEYGVVRWAGGTLELTAAPAADETRPAFTGGADPAVAFIDVSCPLRDAAPVYPSAGIAGAICFGLQPSPSNCSAATRSATLDLVWGADDTGVRLDTAGPLLRLRVAGATATLPVTWMTRRVARYTLAWRVVDGTMTVRVYGGLAGSRAFVEASAPYDAGATAAASVGGLALSGRWLHAYALRWWHAAPAAAAWAAAAAALDAAWTWKVGDHHLVFDASKVDRMRLLPPPDSTVVDEWRAEAPNTAAWWFERLLYGTTSDEPRLTTNPRPGVLYGTGSCNDLQLRPFINGHDFAAMFVFSTTPVAERGRPDEHSWLSLYFEWSDAHGNAFPEMDIDAYMSGNILVRYNGSWDDLIDYATASDGVGGNLYTLGVTIEDTAVSLWYTSRAPNGVRTAVKRSATFTRWQYDVSPEPEVMLTVDAKYSVLHEVRVLSPAPSPAAWEALMQTVDAKWAAL